jgi:hypothetical protein
MPRAAIEAQTDLSRKLLQKSVDSTNRTVIAPNTLCLPFILAPSPGTPGEGWGEGDFEFQCHWCSKSPSPLPSPGVPGEGVCSALSNGSGPRLHAKSGIATIFPPAIADSWAQIPVLVQLADFTSSTYGFRFSTMLRMNSCARCGCEPPCPLPCLNDR